MARRTVFSEWGMLCPKCGRDDQIDISATISVRLTADGTDADEARNGDHEWSASSPAQCAACDYSADVQEFELAAFKAKRRSRAKQRKEVPNA